MRYQISIGVLAYNEAKAITVMLDSLKQQSIFRPSPDRECEYAVEVVVVPNGCVDQTATVAEQCLQHFVLDNQTTAVGDSRIQAQTQITTRVETIPEAGKSNAWNRYVHEFAHPNADYLFLVDADIYLNEPQTLERMLENLINSPSAWVAIDRPIKDVQLRQPQTVMQSMSAQISDEDGSGKGITGQLYCATAAKLRQIWMPPGLSVEDGFLRAMILTDRFTGPENFDRIVYTPNATHVYEAYTGLYSLLRHEKRIVIGTIVNQFLFDYFWANCRPDMDAGTIVREFNRQDPHWVAKLIEQGKRDRGWWLLHKDHTFRRLANLRRYSGFGKLKRLPIELVASFADWLVFYKANRSVRSGQGLGYW
jgi:glycosyltransferase involved in cell wall biosynthesis